MVGNERWLETPFAPLLALSVEPVMPVVLVVLVQLLLMLLQLLLVMDVTGFSTVPCSGFGIRPEVCCRPRRSRCRAATPCGQGKSENNSGQKLRTQEIVKKTIQKVLTKNADEIKLFLNLGLISAHAQDKVSLSA